MEAVMAVAMLMLMGRGRAREPVVWGLWLSLVPGALGWEFISPFRSMYCQLSDCCHCDYHPSADGLELDLCRLVYGQHLVKETLVDTIRDFTENPSPRKPLVLSFHGWSGTGKSYVTSLLVKSLHRDGMKSRYVHQFVPTLHFPHASHIQVYKDDLKRWITGNLSECGRSVFIFDEMDKMHPGLIDAIKPFLGNSHVMFGTNYRKAMFIFVSNAGGDQINQLVLDFWKDRKDREDIKLADLESKLSAAVFNSQSSGFWNSDIINEELVDRFVPFLPLKRKHVGECVRSELLSRGLSLGLGGDLIEEVVNAMSYFPEEHKLFSKTGCKTVAAKLDFYL